MGGNEVKIISSLMKSLQEKISLLQIAKRATLSYNSCYKAALRLEKGEVLFIERKSGVNYCSLKNTTKTHLLAGYVSLLIAESFLSKQVILRKIGEELISQCGLDMDLLVLFGSYAKGNATSKSDIDLFCVSEEDTKIKSFVRHLSLKYDKDIQMVVSNRDELREMFAEDKVNVGKEMRDTGIVLYGYELFWRMVLEGK